MAEVLRQTAKMVTGTVVLLAVMSAFNGASIVNFAYFFLRSIGASDFVGLVTGLGGPRVVATTMFGYVFCAKIGCGIAAELGALKINQEIDAYGSTGVDPMQYVVGTRLAAVILFIPIATVIVLLGIMVGAYLDAVVLLQGVSSASFFQVNWSVQSISDQLFALVTIGAIAVTAALVSAFYGLRTTGGPANVGSAVARSLIVNLVLLHIIAAAFTVAFYSGNLRLPIAS